MNRLKPLFNADNAEEYFSMQLECYRTCQKEIFNRDNQNRDSVSFVYSAEYQKYLGMEIALRKVLEYFAKYELSCETEQAQNYRGKEMRCENCTMYTDNINDKSLRNGFCARLANYNFDATKPTDFCSYFEPKESEDKTQ